MRFHKLASSWIALGLIAFFGPTRSSAALIISVGKVTALAGSTNQVLSIDLQNTGPAAVAVNSMSFQISTAAGVTFTQADISTMDAPYIFAGDSLFGPIISTTSGGQILTASDLFDIPGGSAAIAAGATLGLGDVLFDVDPAASGGVFAVNLSSAGTSLADVSGNIIPSTLVNGQIQINTMSAVPEPSAFAPVGLFLAVVVASRFRRLGSRWLLGPHA